MAIEDVIKQRAHDAYFGAGAAREDEAVLDIILQFFKSLLTGLCPVAVAHGQANGSRLQQARARRRIGWEAASMTSDRDEVEHLVDATMTVAQTTSLEEAKEYAAT